MGMNGEKLHTQVRRPSRRALHGLIDVKKLQIQKDLLPSLLNQFEDGWARTRKQLQPDFDNSHGIVKLIEQNLCCPSIRHIQGHHQPIPCVDVCQPLLPFSHVFH